MFNIGLGELLFIAILVLVVVGPERLPRVMREFGRIVRQIRFVVNEMTSQFAEELQPIQELQQPLQELRQLADDINPVKQVTRISLDLDAKARSQQGGASQSVGPTGGPPPATGVVRPTHRPNPTDAFQARPAGATANPMKVIAQAKKTLPPDTSSPDIMDS